jgi:glutathione S-transferase
MLALYDSAFSPFARKVRLVLDYKGVAHEVLDGLALSNREALAKINARVEVPALDHDGVVVIGSSDIVAYLERAFPEPSVYPVIDAEWVHARAWERAADSVVDAILINVSYWLWAKRDDEMPAGLLGAARADIDQIYAALERDLDGREFISGDAVSIADIALFPHLSAARSLNLPHDRARFPRLDAWLKRLRALPPFAADLERARAFMQTFLSADTHERDKIFWRGDRIEWMLARGYHRWFMNEIERERVLWPGLGIPGGGRR